MGEGKRVWERKEVYETKAVKRKPLISRNAIVMVNVNGAKNKRRASGAMTVLR